MDCQIHGLRDFYQVLIVSRGVPRTITGKCECILQFIENGVSPLDEYGLTLCPPYCLALRASTSRCSPTRTFPSARAIQRLPLPLNQTPNYPSLSARVARGGSGTVESDWRRPPVVCSQRAWLVDTDIMRHQTIHMIVNSDAMVVQWIDWRSGIQYVNSAALPELSLACT